MGGYKTDLGDHEYDDDDAPEAAVNGEADTSPGSVEIPLLVPVAIAEGSAALVLGSSDGTGDEYFLSVDADLLAYIEEALRRVLGPEAPAAEKSTKATKPKRIESKLSPREIQTLLRQGRSTSSIARRAGVPTAWVERFEAPIVAERAGMAERAQRATMVRPRLGPSSQLLGQAVRANLTARGAALEQVDQEGAWDSIKRPTENSWVVSFSYVHRRRQHVAQWEYWPEKSEVQPLNRMASELGWAPPDNPAR